MKRFAYVMATHPEKIAEYKALHTAVWSTVLAQIARSNVRNYTIYLREPENLLFSYFEYHGEDFSADMEKMATDPETQRWWRVCSPCQIPLASRILGEHWALMEEVFHCN